MKCSNFVRATASKNRKKPNFNCCVVCLKSKKKGYNISLHKFPKNPTRRALWLINCRFGEKEIEHNRKLCSSHFKKDCFNVNTTRRVLKQSAVPVIFDKKIKLKRNKKRSQSLSKTVDWSAVKSSNSKVFFIPPLTFMLVKPIAQIPTTLTQDIQTSGRSETILQIQVEDLENPATDVIPMGVLSQFTAQLSGYSLDPEKNDGTNDVPIFQ